MKIVVSRLRKRCHVAAASSTAITGEWLAFISGLFCLAVLLSACQQPSSSASNGSSTVQQSQGSDLEGNRERRCCHRASRGANH